MSRILTAIKAMLTPRKRAAFFAITNSCNCRCQMCSIWKVRSSRAVSFVAARRALDMLWQHRFRILQLTGGEPLLNRDFLKIAAYAKELGFFTFFPTNGTLMTDRIAAALADIGMDEVSVSLHHSDPCKFEQIAGHAGILPKAIRAIRLLQARGVPVSMLCTINRHNMADIEDIVRLADSLGVAISFCTPIVGSGTSYALGGRCAALSRAELRAVVEQVIALKVHHVIINSRTYLEDVLRYLDGGSRYLCRGGTKLFYIDWNLRLWPCMMRGPPIELAAFDSANVGETHCDACTLQCFREPSLLFLPRTAIARWMLRELPYCPRLAAGRLRALLRRT